MGLIENIKNDLLQITSNADEFGQSIVLIDHEGTEITVNGFQTKHYTSIDPEGFKVNSLNASIAISEGNFINFPTYIYKNANNDVSFSGHTAKITDSNGLEQKYFVQQWFPDRSIGLLVLILQRAAND